jgi:hypothetical protein
MAIYESSATYIREAATLKEKITRIDAIITALEETALTAAAGDNVTSYTLDNGQTKINTMYRSAADIASSITAFEKIRVRYLNQLNGGSIVRLVDSSNFTRRNNGRY